MVPPFESVTLYSIIPPFTTIAALADSTRVPLKKFSIISTSPDRSVKEELKTVLVALNTYWGWSLPSNPLKTP